MIKTLATMLQARLTRRYLDLVKDLYTEPREERVVGNLFKFVMMLPLIVFTREAPVKRETNSASSTV